MYRKCEDQVFGTSQWPRIPPGCFHKAGRGFSLLTRLAGSWGFVPSTNLRCFVCVPFQPCRRQNKASVSAERYIPTKLSGKAEGDVAKDANLSQQIWKSEKGRLGLFLFLFILSYNVATLGTGCDRHANN